MIYEGMCRLYFFFYFRLLAKKENHISVFPVNARTDYFSLNLSKNKILISDTNVHNNSLTLRALEEKKCTAV